MATHFGDKKSRGFQVAVDVLDNAIPVIRIGLAQAKAGKRLPACLDQFLLLDFLGPQQSAKFAAFEPSADRGDGSMDHSAHGGVSCGA